MARVRDIRVIADRLSELLLARLELSLGPLCANIHETLRSLKLV